MGFFTFILKNGPGSPGRMTKYYIELYNKLYEKNHDSEWEGIFFMIFLDRKRAFQQLGFTGGCQLNTVAPHEIIKNTEGDFPLFIFIMLGLETAQFRENVYNAFDDVTKIIHDGVREKRPAALKFSLSTFRIKASSYV